MNAVENTLNSVKQSFNGVSETCGCCEGIDKLTPEKVVNRPGLQALVYRVGSHATFLETMLARLTDHSLKIVTEFGDEELLRPLQGLRTRDRDDPSIALLDAWATVADVLSFYQERIANEGFLRTSVERRSILELAHLVGYQLSPGVAATVFLAFELEKDQSSNIAQAEVIVEQDRRVIVPKGTRAQSIPGPDEMPQSFETSRDLEARFVWNKLKPRETLPQFITFGNAEQIDTFYFQGTDTNLQANSPLLLIFGLRTDQQILIFVDTVEADPDKNRTKVTKQKSFEDLADRLTAIIRRYLQLAKIGFPIGRSDVQEVIAVLREMESILSSEQTPDNKFQNLCVNTRILREMFSLAIKRRQTSLTIVVGQIVADIERILIQFRPAAPTIAENLEALLSELLQTLRSKNYPDRLIISKVESILENSQKEIQAQSSRLSYSELSVLLNESLQSIRIQFDLAMQSGEEQKKRDIGDIIKNLADFQSCLTLGDPAFLRLQALINPLLRDPSRQPQNPLRRPISVNRAFSLQGDIAPQLLIAQNPALRKTLYDAWARATVTPSSELKSIQTFRIKAVPFGHDAQPKQIVDCTSAVIASEEWPLSAQRLSIQLFSGGIDTVVEALNSGSIQAVVSAEIDSQPQSVALSIVTGRNNYNVPLGGGTVQISIKRAPRPGPPPLTFFPNIIEIDFVFSGFKQLRSITIDRENMTAKPLKVTIDGSTESARLLAVNEFQRYLATNSKGTISYTGTLSVNDEASVAPEDLKVLALDGVYDEIKPDSWIIIDRPGRRDITRISDVETVSKKEFGLTGKVTQLTLNDPWLGSNDRDLSVFRNTTIYAQSERLDLTEQPIEKDVQSNEIELNGLFDGLEPGRRLVVSGERTDITPSPDSDNVRASELVILTGVTQGPHLLDDATELAGDTLHTTLHLANSLAYTYKRDTVTINANVAHATHGETREEILGSGDGSKAFQEFKLSQSPLTHLSAATPSGIASTLEVRVNDVRVEESDSLAELNPTDRSYITRRDDAGNTFIVFGNGEQGARLPTGAQNVKAVYRNGIGKAGNVKAEQISMLTTQPLGVKSVINPQPGTGGADPDNINEARRNAPIELLTLNRAVSVPDYADFSRAFTGIDKAVAIRLSDGRREIVHVTIAGADNIPISPNSDLFRNLQQALFRFGDPHQPLQLALRELLLIVVSVQVKLVSGHQWEVVEPQIRVKMLDAFGFKNSDLGQDVLLSRVISTIQSVDGVDYVDVDLLDAFDEKQLQESVDLANLAAEFESEGKEQPRKRIPVNFARVDESRRLLPAQLAIITPEVPDTLLLKERT